MENKEITLSYILQFMAENDTDMVEIEMDFDEISAIMQCQLVSIEREEHNPYG